MQKITLFLLMIILSLSIFAQTKTCCSSTEAFAALGNDVAFVNKHEEPVPMLYIEQKGEMITFKVSDGKDANAYAVKSLEKSNKYVLVFHEWWGLNEYIKQMSDKLSSDLTNVNVIAIDLYDGKVATSREDAQNYMMALSQERAMAIMEGLKTKIGAEAEVATIGWCMGGGMSMQASLAFANEAIACIMYYGMPETNIEKLITLQAPVLFIHATYDQWINDEVVKTFEMNMKQVNKQLKVLRYDADHAFANPSNPKHNAEAAQDAYDHVLKFLNERLMGK